MVNTMMNLVCQSCILKALSRHQSNQCNSRLYWKSEELGNVSCDECDDENGVFFYIFVVVFFLKALSQRKSNKCDS